MTAFSRVFPEHNREETPMGKIIHNFYCSNIKNIKIWQTLVSPSQQHVASVLKLLPTHFILAHEDILLNETCRVELDSHSEYNKLCCLFWNNYPFILVYFVWGTV